MPEAIASVIGGGMQASASKRAAETAANAQLEAARMQQEAGREALGLGREQFEYGQEQDLYQRALQRQLAQEQAAQLQNVQPFINLGLGSLGGLSQMVNPTMQIDPGLYELAGMQPQQATDIGPTFDPSTARQAPPAIDFDEMDRYISEQLQSRIAQKQAQEQAKGPTGWQETEDPGDFVREAYRNLLGREADPSGFQYYSGRPRDFVIQDIMGSREYRGRQR